MDEIVKKHLKTISQIFSLFENEQDMAELMTDVCTEKELEAIYQRFRVAQLLKDGWSFTQIVENTGMSSTTITRVSKCLKNGKGYNKMFEKYNLSIDMEK